MQLEHTLSENNGSQGGALVAAPRRPFIVGIGGTLRPNSSSELALKLALAETERLGADVEMIVGQALELPPYDPTRPLAPENAVRLLELLRRADGLIVASAAYHGSIPGFLKNAIDYVEDLREDPLPYLEGRAVGCIICAHGQQALGSTLANMRAIIHTLRGWNTPYAVTISSQNQPVDLQPDIVSEELRQQLRLVASQVVQFATMRINTTIRYHHSLLCSKRRACLP
jgi:FMN reductase